MSGLDGVGGSNVSPKSSIVKTPQTSNSLVGHTVTTGKPEILIDARPQEFLKSCPTLIDKDIVDWKTMLNNSDLEQQENGGVSSQEKMIVTGDKVDALIKPVFSEKVKAVSAKVKVMVKHYGFSPAADLKPAPNIGGSIIGMIRTIASGFKYLGAKRNLKRLEIEYTTLNRNMKSCRNLKTTDTLEYFTQTIKKEELSAKIAMHQQTIETVKKDKTVAVLSTSGLSSNVAALATAAKIGAIATSTVSGVVCGAILTGTAIHSMVKDRETEKSLTKEEQSLTKIDKTKLTSTSTYLVNLRNDNIQTTQKKDIGQNHVKNSLFSTLGGVAMAGGVLGILVKVSVGVTAALVVGSGYGLIAAAVIAIGALAVIGILKYRRMSQGKMGTIIEQQKIVMDLQQELNQGINPVKKGMSQKQEKMQLNKLKQIKQDLDKEKVKLRQLILQHRVEFQASETHKNDITQLFGQIDAFNLPQNKKDISQIAALTGIKVDFIRSDNEGPLDESSKDKLKSLLIEWITNPLSNPEPNIKSIEE